MVGSEMEWVRQRHEKRERCGEKQARDEGSRMEAKATTIDWCSTTQHAVCHTNTNMLSILLVYNYFLLPQMSNIWF